MKRAIQTIKYLIRSNPRMAAIAIALDCGIGALAAVIVYTCLSLTVLPTYAVISLSVLIIVALFAAAYMYLATQVADRLGFDDDIADQLGE